MKKLILTIVPLLFIAFTIQAQNDGLIAEAYPTNNAKSSTIMDRDASITNGRSIASFIQENFEYPMEAKEEGISGNAVVSILVKEDGSASLSNIKGIDSSSITAELQSLVDEMPSLNAAIKNGKAIKQVVSFKMNLQLD